MPIAGKNGPLSDTLGVCDNVAAFKANGHQAQIKKFLDFAYQNKYQLQFDHEYDLLPATVSAANALKSDPTFGSFIKALPHAVQYPSNTAWAQVKTDIQNTIGTAVTGDPSSVLGSSSRPPRSWAAVAGLIRRGRPAAALTRPGGPAWPPLGHPQSRTLHLTP